MCVIPHALCWIHAIYCNLQRDSPSSPISPQSIEINRNYWPIHEDHFCRSVCNMLLNWQKSFCALVCFLFANNGRNKNSKMDPLAEVNSGKYSELFKVSRRADPSLLHHISFSSQTETQIMNVILKAHKVRQPDEIFQLPIQTNQMIKEVSGIVFYTSWLLVAIFYDNQIFQRFIALVLWSPYTASLVFLHSCVTGVRHNKLGARYYFYVLIFQVQRLLFLAKIILP